MTATIVFDDGGGPVTGTVDNGTDDATVTLSNFSDTGVLGWLWELVYKPQSSATVVSSANAASPNIVLDVRGTYLVRLTTYTDAARTIVDDIDEQCYAVRLETPFDWRVPAAGEVRQYDAVAGWALAREESIRDIHTFMNSGLPALTGAVNDEVDGADPETVLGGFVLDGSGFPDNSLKLRLLGVLTVAGAGTGDLRLYDMGLVGAGAVAGALRATATIANVDAGAIIVIDTALTVVGAPGVDADEIVNARHRYELRAELVGGAGGDTLKIHNGSVTLEG